MLPHLVSATGVRSILACLGVFPSELAGGPGTEQAVPRGPQGHMQGSLGQSTALRCGLGQVLGKGAPSPISLSCTLIPDSWSWKRKTLTESRSFCFLLKLLGKMLEAAEGRPTGRGVDGRVEGWGKHHWPSESGIETDGRGEQYYHSKDPMGAIQQIPY